MALPTSTSAGAAIVEQLEQLATRTDSASLLQALSQLLSTVATTSDQAQIRTLIQATNTLLGNVSTSADITAVRTLITATNSALALLSTTSDITAVRTLITATNAALALLATTADITAVRTLIAATNTLLTTGNGSLASILTELQTIRGRIERGAYASTAGFTAVTRSATPVQAIAANANRRGLYFFNDSSAICFLGFGFSPSTASYTTRFAGMTGGMLEAPIYTGVVHAIWQSAGGGTLNLTELA